MKLSLGQVPTLSRICFVLLYRFYGETRQAGLFRGWFTSLEFEKSFEAVMMPWARDPVRLHKKKVVLLDGVASHYNIKVFQMAREVNMFLVFLPLTCTHVLQALNSVIFRRSRGPRFNPRFIFNWTRSQILRAPSSASENTRESSFGHPKMGAVIEQIVLHHIGNFRERGKLTSYLTFHIRMSETIP